MSGQLRLTSRWWRTAGITFAITSSVGFVLSFLFLLVANPWSNDLGRWVGPVTLALVVVIPVALAFLVATIWERVLPTENLQGRRGQRRRKWLTIAAFAFPFVAGPVGLILFVWLSHKAMDREDAKSKAFRNRPITTSTGDYFCAPPRYFVRDGWPMAELTARLPTAGSYSWQVGANDATSQPLGGTIDTALDAGLHVVLLQLDEGNGEPVRKETIRYPVVIRHITLHRLNGDEIPVFLDGRGAGTWEDSLAIVEGP